MRPAATESDKRPGLDDAITDMLRATLRLRCSELAVLLLSGQPAPNLLDEITDLACDCWALRDGDDA